MEIQPFLWYTTRNIVTITSFTSVIVYTITSFCIPVVYFLIHTSYRTRHIEPNNMLGVTMNFKSFRFKIIFPVTILFLTLVIVLIAFLSLRFNTFSRGMQRDLMIADLISLQYFLDESAARTYTAALSMEHSPKLIEAIQNKDRSSMFEFLNGATIEYGIDFFILTDQEGTVILRTSEPTIYGDSIAFQSNIKNAMNGLVSTYAEEGTYIRASIRTGGPVRNLDGDIIALISAGVRFDTKQAVSDIKKIVNSEISVFIGKTRIATTIAQHEAPLEGEEMDDEVYDTVFNRQEVFSGSIMLGGREFMASYVPLLNVDGETFAAIATSNSSNPYHEVIQGFVTFGIIIGLIMLILSSIILVLIISSITKPLTHITKQMDLFSNGHLDIQIEGLSDDEIGRLGVALNRSTQTIKRLMHTIENMISDQKSGYTNYYLESSEFQGAYRRIANNILELTGFSMYDQLTKIPNRRTFDNRLSLEWSHAERDHNPISILMIDIDFFKKYNDSFGHQQGDVALIEVATVLTNSLKRKIDFAARWGGEEFVVLLPNTTLEGAVNVAERIRNFIETTVIPSDMPEAHHVTVSIGVHSQCVYENTFTDQFIHHVDEALYQAKAHGRNRVYTSNCDSGFDALEYESY